MAANNNNDIDQQSDWSMGKSETLVVTIKCGWHSTNR